MMLMRGSGGTIPLGGGGYVAQGLVHIYMYTSEYTCTPMLEVHHLAERCRRSEGSSNEAGSYRAIISDPFVRAKQVMALDLFLQ